MAAETYYEGYVPPPSVPVSEALIPHSFKEDKGYHGYIIRALRMNGITLGTVNFSRDYYPIIDPKNSGDLINTISYGIINNSPGIVCKIQGEEFPEAIHGDLIYLSFFSRKHKELALKQFDRIEIVNTSIYSSADRVDSWEEDWEKYLDEVYPDPLPYYRKGK